MIEGRYKIIEKIGKGGFADIFVVEDLQGFVYAAKEILKRSEKKNYQLAEQV